MDYHTLEGAESSFISVYETFRRLHLYILRECGAQAVISMIKKLKSPRLHEVCLTLLLHFSTIDSSNKYRINCVQYLINSASRLFDVTGHLLCVQTSTDIEEVWSGRTVYEKRQETMARREEYKARPKPVVA